jgi:hypothetical protein
MVIAYASLYPANALNTKNKVMKQRILNYLLTDRSFDGGLSLYMEIGQSMSFKRVLNRQGYTEYNHELLLDQLRISGGISPEEFRAYTEKPVAKDIPVVALGPPTPEEVTAFITELPEYVRKSIKLRDEFPFLREKDCPEELKILVADMISAYENYMQAHERLFAAVTPEDFAAATADVVENYLENREIWDELTHYKEKKELLAKHPIFAQMERFKEIRAMKGDELVKLLKSLENNISRNKKSIEKDPEHPETHNRRERVEAYQRELAEVKRILEQK